MYTAGEIKHVKMHGCLAVLAVKNGKRVTDRNMPIPRRADFSIFYERRYGKWHIL